MGSSETIQNILTENDCRKILARRNIHLTIKNLEYTVVKADDKVRGFLGDYFRLRILFQTDINEVVEEALFFVKTEPIFNKNQRDFVKDCGLFEKEAFIYENILPKLMKLSRINFAPECFSKKNGLMVLEDMKLKNFSLIKRNFNQRECEAMVTCIANYHSASILYEELNSSKDKYFRWGDECLKYLVEGTFSFIEGEPKNRWLKTVTGCIIDFWKTLPNYQDNILHNKLHKIVFEGDLENHIKPSQKFRNVLTHNDLWSNNLMFNEKLECILIDFQLVRYTPPAHDLVMALYFNNSIDFLNENFEQMVNLYYETFCKRLLEYGLKPEIIFPESEYLESIEEYRIFALFEASAFATNVYLPEDRTSYIMSDAERYEEFNFRKRSKYNMDLFETNHIYRNKVLGLIMALAETICEEHCR